MSSNPLRRLAPHVALLGYSLLTVLPILLIIVNSFKTRAAIFGSPYSLPIGDKVSLAGYQTILGQANFLRYFGNSLIVTGTAMVLILLFGAMASFALSEYRFPANTLLGLYLALGIM